MRSALRQLGFGRLAYRLYHAPISAVRASIAAGGPWHQWQTARGRAAMKAAARELPIPAPRDRDPLQIHVLTGRRFWYQTAFCLWSFSRAADRAVAPVILDDGFLDERDAEPLLRLFPHARVVRDAETVARLDECLPASRYPTLRKRREEFALLRKLTDVHAGLTGWKLFLDSDVLFFNRPSLLLEWLADPQQPLRATDVENAYGYSLDLLTELAGRRVDERVNTGILGLCSDALDWDKLEYWCRELIERAGTHYYQEQALVALQLAGRPHLAAPLADYVTFPKAPEVHDCRAVMHHYVAGSKTWYFRQNWGRLLGESPK